MPHRQGGLDSGLLIPRVEGFVSPLPVHSGHKLLYFLSFSVFQPWLWNSSLPGAFSLDAPRNRPKLHLLSSERHTKTTETSPSQGPLTLSGQKCALVFLYLPGLLLSLPTVKSSTFNFRPARERMHVSE